MSFRQIYIKRAEKISLRDNSLVVKNEKREIVVPLEDIASILLEDQETVITAHLLSALAEHYISLITCDKKHLPTSLTLPMNMHYKQLKVFYAQLNVKKPFNSQLWSSVISHKINNQKIAIELCSADKEKMDKLSVYIKEIQSGDKTNREAIAAKVFFEAMYGAFFSRLRTSEDAVNMALNYGYSILIGQMSRVLTMYGFNTNIGIHHCSQSNSFNLACDFVEPFRPLVDMYVYRHLDDLMVPLSIEIRKDLIALLEEKVCIRNKYYDVQFAMEEVVLSYIKCIEKDDSSFIALPEICHLDIPDDSPVEL